MVARAGEKTGLGLMTADDSAPSEMDRESPPSTNEKTPVWQGFEDDCGLVMIAENQEPPVRFELTTYALRKCGTDSATALSDNELRTANNASCTFSCTPEPENVAVDPELARIASVWSKLPAYVRLAVMSLVTNAIPSESP